MMGANKIYRFMLSAILYCVLTVLAQKFLVFPENVLSMAAFLAPLLGLMGGAWGGLGAAVGHVAVVFLMPALGVYAYLSEAMTVFVAAYFPYKLWHTVFIDSEGVFAFSVKNLLKFVLITFLSVSAAVFFLMTYEHNDTYRIFAALDVPVHGAVAYAAILFLNNFNVAIFFGMPVFFLLISYNFKFYLPPQNLILTAEPVHKLNRWALIFLYGFFFALFITLDVSEVIYDLDKMDTWLMFNGEILSMMNITLFALMYMLLKYRHSIMTNLTLLEMASIFIAALLLGSVSFVAISGIINEHVDNDLQKMSVIYRERLSHTFTNTRMAINSMSRMAVGDLPDDIERIKTDEILRQNYLNNLERNFNAVADGTVGTIGFYMRFSPDIAENAGFICTRTPDNWGTKMPPFVHRETNPYNDRYHTPYERYLAKISEPYLDENTGHYILSYVVPLQKNEKYIGIVGVDIDFNYIIHEIRRMSVYENGYVSLLDKNGEVLYANRLSAQSNEENSDFYVTETYLSNGIWLKIAAFAHDVYAGRNNMLIHFTVVMLFVVIAVSFFSIFLAGKGIRPLMMIGDAAKKIAVGDLDVKLSYAAKNELGNLVDSIKEMAGKLEIYVYHDELTGLYNTAAYARAKEKIAKNNFKHSEYAVAVFDANFLKRINDTYGHEAGNELIKRAAGLIKRTFANSRVYRIGGDEFATILEGEDFKHRDILLKKFDEESARESFEVGGERISVSVARGLAVRVGEAECFDEVFRSADATMYEHKAAIKAKMKQ